MRMWMINPKYMCKQHLLGEHLEVHMIKNEILRGKPLRGFINNGLIEPHNVYKRHEKIVKELIKRGVNHKTPMEPFETTLPKGKINRKENVNIISNRCERCATLMKENNVY